MTYTVRQAASILGVAYSTVTLHCRKLELPRHGSAYLIDDEAIERLHQSIVGVPGNPQWKRKQDAS